MRIDKLLIIPDAEQMERSIAIAKQYGCGFEYNDFYDPVFVDSSSCDERIVYYKTMEQLPQYCTMHGAFFDVTVFSDDPKIAEVSDLRVEQSLEIACKLGVKAVVFHTNFVPNFNTEAYHNNWVERNVRYWAEKLEKYKDIHIYIENMFDMSYRLLERLAKQLCRYPNFGVCLDYAHVHAFGKKADPEEWVRELAPYVKHVHINDNDLESDLHLKLGEGRIDWKQFKEYYEKYFPQASVLVEMRSLDAAEQSLMYIQQL